MAFLGVERKKGEIIKKHVTIGKYNDGTPVNMPVVTITGLRDGPTVYLQSGAHGDEVTGIEVVHQVIASLKPEEISGSVVAVTVANPPSYVSRTRGWILEERLAWEMMSHMPGSTVGLMTERLAYAMFNEFMTHADITLDNHTSIDGFKSVPFTRVVPDDGDGTYELLKKLAYGSGAPYVWDIIPISRDADVSRMPLPNRFGGRGSIAGKPFFNFEMGESRRVSYEYVPIGVRGVRRMLQILDVLPGEPEPLNEPQRTFNQVDFVHNDRGGPVRFSVGLGDEVKKGQQIAAILDLFGDTVEELTSPVDGFVFRTIMLHSAHTGAEIAWIAH